MISVSLKGRVVLLTPGREEFLAQTARLFIEAGSRVFVHGKENLAGTENIEAAAGPSEVKAVCAEIKRRTQGIDILIVCALWQPIISHELVAVEINRAIDYLKVGKDVLGSYPKYVVIVTPQREETLASAGSASIKTLVGYLTKHLQEEDVRINHCHYASSGKGERRAAEAAFIMCSGLLDELRGQHLVLSDV